MTLAELSDAAGAAYLDIMGVVQEGCPDGIASLVLLGPAAQRFWPHFTASQEYRDGAPDPLDRWSERVITGLAVAFGATPFFPFGGPPYQPFIGWALTSGSAHLSPVGLLVHERAGLMVSYRGALGFAQRVEAPSPGPNPCDACAEKPCLSACPVDALAGDGYDVAGCKADLARDGNDCMDMGCAVRRACPVSRAWGRDPDQSAFHMRAFA